jgi:hypothetical protein
MEMYGGTAPLILTFGKGCGWEIGLATQPFYFRDKVPLLTEQEFGRFTKAAWTFRRIRCLTN